MIDVGILPLFGLSLYYLFQACHTIMKLEKDEIVILCFGMFQTEEHYDEIVLRNT